jgi:hypothetical protein
VVADIKPTDAGVEKEEEKYKKHVAEKEELATRNIQMFGPMMRHYINCGFNLLIYGIGSKWSFINNFAHKFLQEDHRIFVNGYHSATNMKSVTNPLVNFA